MVCQPLVLLALFSTAGASKHEQCQTGAPQALAAEGSILLQVPAEVKEVGGKAGTSVNAQGRKKIDMKTITEHDSGVEEVLEFMEEEIMDDIISEDEGNCPSYCGWSKVTKHDWSLKCWTWACQECPDWKQNCPDTTKTEDESALCIPKCKRFLQWADRSRRNPKAMRCSTVKCQSCDNSEHKCKPPLTYFKLKSKEADSNKCLHLDLGNDNVLVWDCHDSDKELWAWDAGRLRSKAKDNLCVTMGSENGQTVKATECGLSADQQIKREGETLSTSTECVVEGNSKRCCLDWQQDDTNDVIAWGCHSDANQQWTEMSVD